MPDQPSPHAGQGDFDDQELQRLFAQRLPEATLPPAVLDRVVHGVLQEVQNSGLGPQPVAPLSPPVRQPAPKPDMIDRVRTWLGTLRAGQALLLAGAGALAVMLVFAGVSRLTPRPISATADVVGGDATVLRAHNNSYRIYRDGDKLKVAQGDQVLTRNGRVVLSLFPDQLATIEPGANVELLKLDDANGGTQVALAVHDGVLHSDINRPLAATDSYVVMAPGGLTVAAHGTDFTVEAISEEETVVTTIKGEVEVSLDGKQVDVPAGQEVDAVVGEALQVAPADREHDSGPEPILVAVNAGDGLRVFTLPDEQAAALGRLVAGKALQIVDQDPSGQWYKVCCVAGQAGWVRVPSVEPAQ